MPELSLTDGAYTGMSSTDPSSQPLNTKRTAPRRPWAFKARPEKQPQQPAPQSPTSSSEGSSFSGSPVSSGLSTTSDHWMSSAPSNPPTTLTCLAQSTPASPTYRESETWYRHQGYRFLEDKDSGEQIWADFPTSIWDLEVEQMTENTRRSRKWPKRTQRKRGHGDESKQHSRKKMMRRTQGAEGRIEEELES